MSLSSSMMTILDMVRSGTRPFVADDFGRSLHRSGAAPPFPIRRASITNVAGCGHLRDGRQVARDLVDCARLGSARTPCATRYDPQYRTSTGVSKM